MRPHNGVCTNRSSKSVVCNISICQGHKDGRLQTKLLVVSAGERNRLTHTKGNLPNIKMPPSARVLAGLTLRTAVTKDSGAQARSVLPDSLASSKFQHKLENKKPKMLSKAVVPTLRSPSMMPPHTPQPLYDAPHSTAPPCCPPPCSPSMMPPTPCSPSTMLK